MYLHTSDEVEIFKRCTFLSIPSSLKLRARFDGSLWKPTAIV